MFGFKDYDAHAIRIQKQSVKAATEFNFSL